MNALDRYFWTEKITVLTASRHRANRQLAKKLKGQVEVVLDSYPHEFDTSYEELADSLEVFLESPIPKLMPKRSHPKSARQVLIRELLLGWRSLAGAGCSPVKHVLNLVSALDSSITEREIYREQVAI